MADSGYAMGSEAAPHACGRCRKAKRRCTKELPKCNLCVRLGKQCDYSESPASSASDDVTQLHSRISELEARLEQRSAEHVGPSAVHRGVLHQPLLSQVTPGLINKGIPSMFFLDSDIFKEARLMASKPNILVPNEIWSTLGDINNVCMIAAKFFSTIHIWLPCISKKRLELTLSNPEPDIKADLALLLVAMKMITASPSTFVQGPGTDTYWMVKNYFSVLESHGLVSVQMVQCGILIAAYEIGHGIYPSAYLSPARVARLGQALGVDNRLHAPQLVARIIGAWAELEELKRVWWAIMLLDRYVNLGINGHAPATEEASKEDFLPADDMLWDQGEPSSVEPLYVATSTNVKAGPFARTCQATNLVGKYVRHKSDRSGDLVSHFQEAMQLHRTLSAFSRLLQDEVSQKPLEFGTALALCLTCQIHLYDPYSCTEHYGSTRSREESEMQTVAIASLRSTATEVLQFSELSHTAVTANLDAASPLILDCVYQGASTYAWLVHETGRPEMVHAYRTFVSILQTLAKRWEVAQEYLNILEQTKTIVFDNNPML